MCLIIIKKENKPLVSNEMIADVWDDNPHGAGIIFRRHNSECFQMLKGLMVKEDLINAIDKLKLTDKDFIAYHMRWATSGGISPKTTHPFIVHEDVGNVEALSAHNSMKTLYVMHNGIIKDLNDKNADVSDTVRFTSEYLSKLKVKDLFNCDVTKQLIEKFIDGSRLFLAHSLHGYIMYGDWHEYKDYLVSKPYEEATKSTCYYNNFNRSYWYDNEQLEFDWYSKEDNKDEDWCDWCGYYKEVKLVSEYSSVMCDDCIKEFVG